MSITRAEDTVINILKNNWNAANTNQVTPLIDSIKKWKRVGGIDNRGDVVLVNETTTTQEVIGIGGSPRHTKTLITIDMRTFENRANLTWIDHIMNVLKEVDRIITSNQKNPDSNYEIIDFGNWQDWSDKERNMGRYTYDCYLEKLAEAI